MVGRKKMKWGFFLWVALFYLIEREREREAVFLTITKPAEFYSEGVGSHRRKSLDRLSFASQRRPEVDIPSFS